MSKSTIFKIIVINSRPTLSGTCRSGASPPAAGRTSAPGRRWCWLPCRWLRHTAGRTPSLRHTSNTAAYHYKLDLLVTQLSPAIILMSGGAHECGIVQSDLFTRGSQNLVSGKLRRSGFWRYGQFFKWNRVKMAKNGFKMVEIFLGASHMINNYIFYFFCYSTFSFGYFLDLVFWAIFSKFG